MWHYLQAVLAIAVYRPDEHPSTPPSPIHLGFRLGRNHLRALLDTLQEIGVDHVILNLKYGKRPAAEVIEELGKHIVPQFGAQVPDSPT